MNQHDAYDARLAQALGDLADARFPDYTSDVLARTRRSRQRPAWTFLERWFPMTTIAQRAPAARPLALIPRGLLILLVLWAIVALTVAGLAIGGQLSFTRAVMVPAPVTGPAANGLIAFERDGDIYVVKPDGTGERPLIAGPAFESGATWSRDGLRIAYVSSATEEAPPDLILANADGTGATTVATGLIGGSNNLDWSPDGSAVIFMATTDPTGVAPCADRGTTGEYCSYRIFKVATDGSTGAVAIGDPDLDARGPTWSPDGTAIAFGGGSTRDATLRLYLMDPDGRNVRPISTSSGAAGFSFMRSGWSPDGSQIITQVGAAQTSDIVLVAADGSGDTMVTDTPGYETAASFASDGSMGWWDKGADRAGPCCIAVQGSDGEQSALPGEAWPWFSPDGQYVLNAPPAGSPVFVIARDGTTLATIPDTDGASWQRLAP